MATQVQTRRGTTAQHSTFTGAAGELTVDTDKKTVVVHDGTTAGGAPLLRESGSQNAVTTGTSTAASFIPSSSTAPTNGVYLPAANTVGISTGGSGKLFINSTGTVSIGTASPSLSSALEVYATAPVLTVNSAIGNPSSIRLQQAGTTYARFRFDGNNVDIGNLYSGGATILNAGNAERLRITSAGLVGVGTSSPQKKTHFAISSGTGLLSNYDGLLLENQTSAIGSTVGIGFGFGGLTNGTSAGITAIQAETTQTAAHLAFFTRHDASGGSTAEKMRINSSGNVGIGTSSPLLPLHVEATTDGPQTLAYLVNASTGGTNETAALAFGLKGTAGTGICRINAGKESDHSSSANTDTFLSFATTLNDTEGERLRITSAGNVGIGVTPSYKLHVDNGTTTDAAYLGNGYGGLVFGCNSSGERIINTNASGPIVFQRGGTETARIDSSSRLLVGTSTSFDEGNQLQVNGTLAASFYRFGADDGQVSIGSARGTVASPTTLSSTDHIGNISFRGHDGSSFKTGARIRAEIDGITPSSDLPTRLTFSTTADGAASPTEHVRINSFGNLLSGKNSTSFSTSGTVLYGTQFPGAIDSVRSGGYLIALNRLASDGNLIEFYRDGALQGSISVSAGTISYNPFLGSHYGRLSDNQKVDIPVGTILETVDKLIEWKVAVFGVDGEEKIAAYNGSASVGETVEIDYEGNSYEALIEYEKDFNPNLNKHVCVKVNDTTASKAVFGVFLGWDEDQSKDVIGTWNDMYCAAVGNYFIRMAAGQEPEIGDLIEADGAGCGVIQDDDIIRTKTVAKITSTIPQATYDDGSFLVTCVLCCG